MELAEDGTITAHKAERLNGTLLIRGRGFGKDWRVAQGKGHIWARRSAELRELGIILDEDGLAADTEEATVPLGTVLRALRQAWPSPASECSASG